MNYLLMILIGYLFGCSSMSYYIGKINGFNMKEKGTGNLGASNTMMLMGWKAGVLVALHDVLKAILAITFVRYLFGNVPYSSVITGTACILGHIFPFYLGFKGGKGLASYIGVALALDWKFALGLIVVAIIVTLVTDYIVSATFTTMLVTPVYFALSVGLIAGCILGIASIVMVFKHLENIQRILNGTEVGLRSANRGEQRL